MKCAKHHQIGKRQASNSNRICSLHRKGSRHSSISLQRLISAVIASHFDCLTFSTPMHCAKLCSNEHQRHRPLHWREIMAAAQFSLPKQWEDWCNWLLGLWLCISPWAVRFDLEPIATRTAVVIGILIILTVNWRAKRTPFWGDRHPIGTPEQRANIGFHDSWKPRLECWSWRRLRRFAVRSLGKGSRSRRSAGSWVYPARS